MVRRLGKHARYLFEGCLHKWHNVLIEIHRSSCHIDRLAVLPKNGAKFGIDVALAELIEEEAFGLDFAEGDEGILIDVHFEVNIEEH